MTGTAEDPFLKRELTLELGHPRDLGYIQTGMINKKKKVIEMISKDILLIIV